MELLTKHNGVIILLSCKSSENDRRPVHPQANPGDYVAVDLGYAGCQPWPGQLQLTSPLPNGIINGCMPTAFTADASANALQPGYDSSDWANLLTVQNFHPVIVSSRWDGIFYHTFAIQPEGSQDGPPTGTLPVDKQLSFEVSVDITSDVILPLDIDDWFEGHSRICCLNISAVIASDTGFQQLPPWLSLWYNLTQPTSGQQLFAQHALKVSAQPGVAAIGNHTLRVFVADQNLPNQPDQPAASIDLQLCIVGEGPTIVGMFPSIEIADGQPLQYTLPGSVFQLNKPYGQLSYGAQQLASMPLPAWLRFDESGLLSGTPQEGSDATYNLTITATDTDGSRNATFLMLYVKAPCPSGLYRHFRVQISAANNGKTAICSILWGADQPRVVHFPTAEATTAGAVAAPAERAFNVSCGRALPGYDADAIEHQPAKAFQQLLNDKVTCDPWPGNSWTVGAYRHPCCCCYCQPETSSSCAVQRTAVRIRHAFMAYALCRPAQASNASWHCCLLHQALTQSLLAIGQSWGLCCSGHGVQQVPILAQ